MILLRRLALAIIAGLISIICASLYLYSKPESIVGRYVSDNERGLYNLVIDADGHAQLEYSSKSLQTTYAGALSRLDTKIFLTWKMQLYKGSWKPLKQSITNEINFQNGIVVMPEGKFERQ